MSTNHDTWPSDDDLSNLARDSGELRHAWALVQRLSKLLLAERTKKRPKAPRGLVGAKPEDWNERIQRLENKIVSQKKTITELEECRKFEAESERLLVHTLQIVADNPSVHWSAAAQSRLDAHARRQGPRPS